MLLTDRAKVRSTIHYLGFAHVEIPLISVLRLQQTTDAIRAFIAHGYRKADAVEKYLYGR